MRLPLGQVRGIIREVLEEADRGRLVTMFRDLAKRIENVGPATPQEELDSIGQAIMGIGSADIDMGERLQAFLDKRKNRTSSGTFAKAPTPADVVLRRRAMGGSR